MPGWEKIFVEGEIGWRHVSWGGVPIDDRAYQGMSQHEAMASQIRARPMVIILNDAPVTMALSNPCSRL